MPPAAPLPRFWERAPLTETKVWVMLVGQMERALEPGGGVFPGTRMISLHACDSLSFPRSEPGAQLMSKTGLS